LLEGVAMLSELDVLGFWCWHKDCRDFGKKGVDNIVLKERYGKNNIALLLCKTCGHSFSENRSTPFFELKTTRDEVLRTLALLPEKGSIRGVARATGHDKNTICRWLDLAGAHCREVTEYYLNELCLDRVQVDEIRSYIKKEKNVTCSDPDEYGDVYSLTAIKIDTRLFLSHHEGDRTNEDAMELFRDVERRRSIHSPIPVFTSDN